jgi:hypothetical protein
VLEQMYLWNCRALLVLLSLLLDIGTCNWTDKGTSVVGRGAAGLG